MNAPAPMTTIAGSLAGREAELRQLAADTAKLYLPQITPKQLARLVDVMIAAGSTVELLQNHPEIEVGVGVRRLGAELVAVPSVTEAIERIAEAHQARSGEAMSGMDKAAMFRRLSNLTGDEMIETCLAQGVQLPPMQITTPKITVPVDLADDHASAQVTAPSEPPLVGDAYFESEIERLMGLKRNQMTIGDYQRLKNGIIERDRSGKGPPKSQNERMIEAGVKKFSDLSPTERITLERQRLARVRGDKK